MAMASSSSRNQTSSRSFSSAFASSSAASFTLGASSRMTLSSASNVTLHGLRSLPSSPPSPTSTVRLSVDQRSASPGRRSMTVTKKQRNNNNAVPSTASHQKKTCMCSPTTHPGSFRCAYHKRLAERQRQQQQQQTASSRGSTKLNLRRSAMKNSLVRIGGVEGELARRTLTTLIRPSSNQLRRPEAFQARPSRLSVMSSAQDS